MKVLTGLNPKSFVIYFFLLICVRNHGNFASSYTTCDCPSLVFNKLIHFLLWLVQPLSPIRCHDHKKQTSISPQCISLSFVVLFRSSASLVRLGANFLLQGTEGWSNRRSQWPSQCRRRVRQLGLLWKRRSDPHGLQPWQWPLLGHSVSLRRAAVEHWSWVLCSGMHVCQNAN